MARRITAVDGNIAFNVTRTANNEVVVNTRSLELISNKFTVYLLENPTSDPNVAENIVELSHESLTITKTINHALKLTSISITLNKAEGENVISVWDDDEVRNVTIVISSGVEEFFSRTSETDFADGTFTQRDVELEMLKRDLGMLYLSDQREFFGLLSGTQPDDEAVDPDDTVTPSEDTPFIDNSILEVTPGSAQILSAASWETVGDYWRHETPIVDSNIDDLTLDENDILHNTLRGELNIVFAKQVEPNGKSTTTTTVTPGTANVPGIPTTPTTLGTAGTPGTPAIPADEKGVVIGPHLSENGYARPGTVTNNRLYNTGVPKPLTGDILLIDFESVNGLVDNVQIKVSDLLAVPAPVSTDGASHVETGGTRNVVKVGWAQNDWLYFGVSTIGATAGTIYLSTNDSKYVGTFRFRVLNYSETTPAVPAVPGTAGTAGTPGVVGTAGTASVPTTVEDSTVVEDRDVTEYPVRIGVEVVGYNSGAKTTTIMSKELQSTAVVDDTFKLNMTNFSNSSLFHNGLAEIDNYKINLYIEVSKENATLTAPINTTLTWAGGLNRSSLYVTNPTDVPEASTTTTSGTSAEIPTFYKRISEINTVERETSRAGSLSTPTIPVNLRNRELIALSNTIITGAVRKDYADVMNFTFSCNVAKVLPSFMTQADSANNIVAGAPSIENSDRRTSILESSLSEILAGAPGFPTDNTIARAADFINGQVNTARFNCDEPNSYTKCLSLILALEGCDYVQNMISGTNTNLVFRFGAASMRHGTSGTQTVPAFEHPCNVSYTEYETNSYNRYRIIDILYPLPNGKAKRWKYNASHDTTDSVTSGYVETLDGVSDAGTVMEPGLYWNTANGLEAIEIGTGTSETAKSISSDTFPTNPQIEQLVALSKNATYNGVVYTPNIYKWNGALWEVVGLNVVNNDDIGDSATESTDEAPSRRAVALAVEGAQDDDALKIEAYSSTATYSRGSANSIVTYNNHVYVYISSQRNTNHDPDNHPQYWWKISTPIRVLNHDSTTVTHWRSGEFFLTETGELRMATATLSSSPADIIANHTGADQEFIWINEAGGAGEVETNNIIKQVVNVQPAFTGNPTGDTLATVNYYGNAFTVWGTNTKMDYTGIAISSSDDFDPETDDVELLIVNARRDSVSELFGTSEFHRETFPAGSDKIIFSEFDTGSLSSVITCLPDIPLIPKGVYAALWRIYNADGTTKATIWKYQVNTATDPFTQNQFIGLDGEGALKASSLAVATGGTIDLDQLEWGVDIASGIVTRCADVSFGVSFSEQSDPIFVNYPGFFHAIEPTSLTVDVADNRRATLGLIFKCLEDVTLDKFTTKIIAAIANEPYRLNIYEVAQDSTVASLMLPTAGRDVSGVATGSQLLTVDSLSLEFKKDKLYEVALARTDTAENNMQYYDITGSDGFVSLAAQVLQDQNRFILVAQESYKVDSVARAVGDTIEKTAVTPFGDYLETLAGPSMRLDYKSKLNIE